MQLFGPTGSRSQREDRNPTTVANGAAVAVFAGNTVTVIATYTVPADRRAIVVAHGAITVSTALAAGQIADLDVLITPSGGAATVTAFKRRTGSAVDQVADLAVERIELRAGDLVRVRVTVGVGAGAVTGAGGIQGVEYDA